MSNNIVNLNEFAEGALAHRFNEELQRIMENIADPNTDPKKARTLTVTVKVSGDDGRDVLNSSVSVTSKLLPAKEADTKILMGADKNGRIVGNELKSGIKDQMFIDKEGDVADDVGDKVISFKEQRS